MEFVIEAKNELSKLRIQNLKNESELDACKREIEILKNDKQDTTLIVETKVKDSFEHSTILQSNIEQDIARKYENELVRLTSQLTVLNSESD